MNKIPIDKFYLGDGVYVQFDSFDNLVLTTEDGIKITNKIILEKEVFETLIGIFEQGYNTGEECPQ